MGLGGWGPERLGEHTVPQASEMIEERLCFHKRPDRCEEWYVTLVGQQAVIAGPYETLKEARAVIRRILKAIVRGQEKIATASTSVAIAKEARRGSGKTSKSV